MSSPAHPADHATTRTPGPTRRFVRRLRSQPIAMSALVVLLVMVLAASFAPLLTSHDPNHVSLRDASQGPSGQHWLGTDDLGRDLWSRLLYGARVTLTAPLIAVGVGIALAVPVGLVAAFRGGWFDWLCGRLADALMALPAVIIALAFVAVRGNSIGNAMVAVGLAFAPRLFRVVRAATLSVRHEPFIDASRLAGASDRRLIFSHVLPNVAPALIVQSTILLGMAVLAEAALSFLGIGVQPPTATWGVQLRRGFDNLSDGAYASIAPGVAITLLILAFQFLGDGLRDSLGREVRRG